MDPALAPSRRAPSAFGFFRLRYTLSHHSSPIFSVRLSRPVSSKPIRRSRRSEALVAMLLEAVRLGRLDASHLATLSSRPSGHATTADGVAGRGVYQFWAPTAPATHKGQAGHRCDADLGRRARVTLTYPFLKRK